MLCVRRAGPILVPNRHWRPGGKGLTCWRLCRLAAGLGPVLSRTCGQPPSLPCHPVQRDEAKDFFRQKMGWPSEEAERRGSLPLGPLLASASASADDQGALASLYATVVSDQTSPALQSEIVDEVVKVGAVQGRRRP
jgi:hypothetical protein